jgi:hypothetical protein
MTERCLFCGGEAYEPDHLLHCGAALQDLPLLVSGITADTRATSAAAAVVNDETTRDTQRAAVAAMIRASGRHGHTDDELQVILDLDGSSERPRRWELWKRDHIRILRDAEGKTVRRLTRSGRWAVVWVSVEA